MRLRSVTLSLLICAVYAFEVHDPPRMPTVTLASGHEMPMLGFGTASLGDRPLESISAAVKYGYRVLDTAKIYNGTSEISSEEVIGEVLKKSGIPRENFFIITKIAPWQFSNKSCTAAILQSLKFLKTSYIDLVLIHAPYCDFDRCKKESGTYLDGWRCLENLVDEGIVRSIGVSNYLEEELIKTLKIAKHPISVVQNWFDPFKQAMEVRQFCAERYITFMGYSTLGGVWVRVGYQNNPVLRNSRIIEIAKKHRKTPASVVLKWAMDHNVVVVPSSRKDKRIKENLASLYLRLSKNDSVAIDQLGSNKKKRIREL